ncbi:FtsX-like permease family protein [Marinobacter salicampi]|uniref:FtsX-like permease family protein n=1 Tax=Marinobacter salicampi TaxID=435907 RepID=UPI00140AF5C4|nr:FtsX-like permease family protein [Marinobacter salicampi]
MKGPGYGRLLPLAVVSHYRRHPLQVTALLLILILATGLLTGVWDLTRQARHSMEQGDEAIGSRYQIVRQDSQSVTVADFVRLRRGGLCVLPWLEVSRPPPEGRVIGVDPLSVNCLRSADDNDDSRVAPGLGQAPFMDIGAAAAIAQEGYDSQLRLLVRHAGLSVPEPYRVTAVPGGLSTGELADSFLLNLDALSVLVLLITVLLVRSVYNLGLVQRRASLALLQRYGVPGPVLSSLLIAELVLLAVIASVPGLWLGQLLARVFASGFGQVMGNLFDLRLYGGTSLVSSYLLTLFTLLAVLAWCAADALGLGRRITGWLKVGPTGPVLAVAILIPGLAGLVWGSKLWLVFIAVGLVLLGIGLLIPILLARLIDRSARRSREPLQHWSRRELALMLRQVALPAVALQFAVAAVIAVQALVTTFESTFTQWLEQRLQGDVYIEVPDKRDISQVAEFLDSSSDVAAWHTVARGTARIAGDSVDLLVLPADSSLLDAWQFLEAVPQPWQALAIGGVMVNEQLARRNGLALGDTLTVTVAGAPYSAAVVAVYADYGRPVGEVLVPRKALPADFEPRFRSLTVQLAAEPAKGLAELRSELEALWRTGDLQLRDNQQIRQLATGVFDQTFALTRAISVLTLALANASLLLMGWVFFSSRRWYYQLLQVWGLARGELGSRIRRLSTSLTLLVGLSALGPGVLLTWVLVSRINPLAFGWSLPMAVYPLFWLEILALCLLVGLAIAALFQLQNRRQAPAPLPTTLGQGVER